MNKLVLTHKFGIIHISKNKEELEIELETDKYNI